MGHGRVILRDIWCLQAINIDDNGATGYNVFY